MAKALYGHLTHPVDTGYEIARLRGRVAELEAEVAGLRRELDLRADLPGPDMILGSTTVLGDDAVVVADTVRAAALA